MVFAVCRPPGRAPAHVQPSHVEAKDPTSNSIQNLRIPLYAIKAPFPPAATSFRLRLPTYKLIVECIVVPQKNNIIFHYFLF